MPATGRDTIFDCPRATIAMVFQRSEGRSLQLISLPSSMLRLMVRTFLENKAMPAIRKRIKIKLLTIEAEKISTKIVKEGNWDLLLPVSTLQKDM